MELKVTIKTNLNNPDLGDLWLDDDGHEVLETELGAEVAQRLTVRFNFFLGEWFLDESEGTPWYQRILKKAPEDRVIRAVIRQVVESTEGVSQLLTLSYEITRDRRLLVSFTAQLVDGSTFVSTEYRQFTIDLTGE
jgi:hypothetical protein